MVAEIYTRHGGSWKTVVPWLEKLSRDKKSTSVKKITKKVS